MLHCGYCNYVAQICYVTLPLTLRCVTLSIVLVQASRRRVLSFLHSLRKEQTHRETNKRITKHFHVAVLFVLFSSERTRKHSVITFVFVDPNWQENSRNPRNLYGRFNGNLLINLRLVVLNPFSLKIWMHIPLIDFCKFHSKLVLRTYWWIKTVAVF